MDYAELEKDKQELYRKNYMLYKEYILNIEKIASFQRQSYEKYKQECLAQQSQENSTITEESQRLQLSRNHIDLDLKVRRKEFFVIIL
jgi:hypothetical protein